MEAKEKTMKRIKEAASGKTLMNLTSHRSVKFFGDSEIDEQLKNIEIEQLKKLLFLTPSIMVDIIEWIIEKSIERRQQLQKLKGKLSIELNSFTNILESTLQIEHEEKIDKMKNLIDGQPIPCIIHTFNVAESIYLPPKSRAIERRLQYEEDKLAKFDKTLPSNKQLADRNYLTNPGAFRKENKTQTTHIFPRNQCLSLITVDSSNQPQSPVTNKLRQELFCPLFDNFKERKQKLSKKQKQNILNLRNITYTFDYSSQKINVHRTGSPKTPLLNNVSAIMDIESGSKTRVQIENLSTFEKAQIPYRVKKSFFVDGLIQGGSPAETNQSAVLKGLLDKIMNSNKGLRMPSVNKHSSNSKKK